MGTGLINVTIFQSDILVSSNPVTQSHSKIQHGLYQIFSKFTVTWSIMVEHIDNGNAYLMCGYANEALFPYVIFVQRRSRQLMQYCCSSRTCSVKSRRPVNSRQSCLCIQRGSATSKVALNAHVLRNDWNSMTNHIFDKYTLLSPKT